MDDYSIDKFLIDFESKSLKDENGIEFWGARDLQKLLEYDKWDKFKDAIQKAIEACISVTIPVNTHFQDYKLTRNAKNF